MDRHMETMELAKAMVERRGEPETHPSLIHERWRGPRAKTRTAFILSGGGAHGVLQVGALRALMEEGIRPDMVIGTSIGAWNGAWLAYKPTLDGVVAIAAAWRAVHVAGVLLGRQRSLQRPPGAQGGLLMLEAARRVSRGHPSMYSGAGVRGLLERLMGDLTFEDTAIPFRVIATDITRGARATLKSGPLVPAILASSALPGIFPPVRIGESVYTDGGPLDDASLECAIELGANRLFILAIGHERGVDGATPAPTGLVPRDEWMRGIRAHAAMAVVQRSTQVMDRFHLERALRRLPRRVETHLIELSVTNTCGFLDFDHAASWLDHAYPHTQDYLRRALLRAVPVDQKAV
jgi:NTE family protein